MKILAFGASNSKNSINKQFVSHALNLIKAENKTLLDLNNFPLPIYGIDLENEIGIPESAQAFLNHIEEADLLLISLAEHNGSYTAVFKNLLDWMSRKKSKCFEGKKMILLSTSTGARGGRSVMDAALVRFPIHGAEILGHLCLPNFKENFDSENGVVNETYKAELENLLSLV